MCRYQGEPFVVQSGDAHVTFVPEDTVRVTAGVDAHMAAEVRLGGRCSPGDSVSYIWVSTAVLPPHTRLLLPLVPRC